MDKKTIVLITLILLIIAGGGTFWWWESKEKEGIRPSSKPLNDIVVKETPKEKFVEIRKRGLVVKVPQGWAVQKPTSEQEPVILFDPEELKEGKVVYKIEVSVADKKADIPALKKEITSNLSEYPGPEILNFLKFETVTIKGYEALKTVIDTTEAEDSAGSYSSSIYIPINDKVYRFSIFAGYQNKRKAIQEFDRFLETISIENKS